MTEYILFLHNMLNCTMKLIKKTKCVMKTFSEIKPYPSIEVKRNIVLYSSYSDFLQNTVKMYDILHYDTLLKKQLTYITSKHRLFTGSSMEETPHYRLSHSH